jgi:pimeloyl-ACP methyl ester carboxylesterase
VARRRTGASEEEGHVAGVVDSFQWEGHRLVYEVHGEGPRVLVYTHGLLLDATLNRRLAIMLAERGHRVVLPELLGHGRSDKPAHAYKYRMEFWAQQTAALLDHLGVDDAAVGGVSLGANIALQLAKDRPERVRALVVEMPVLERGTLVGAGAFLPVLFALRYLPSAFRPVNLLARRVPDRGHPLESFAHLAAGQPRELAAVLHGLFVGPTTPPEPVRRRLPMSTRVLGHGRDALHALDDARALAREMPNTTFVRARSILEARTRPDRVVTEMDRFLRSVWGPVAVSESSGG